MDNYKEQYSGLKNLSSTVNCATWNNPYGLEQECSTSAISKWPTSMEGSNYPSQSSCYYQSGNSSGIKSEYDSMYVQPDDCQGENGFTFKYGTYLESEAKASDMCPSSTNSNSQQPVTVPCPPDSTFNPSNPSPLTKSVRTSQGSSKCKSESSLKSKQVPGGYQAKSDESTDSSTVRKVILRPHSTPATLMWLESNYELAEGVCIPRSVLYMHYVDFCGLNRVQPVNAASFGKIIRQQFPHLTTRRLGTRGQSRYHYYGIGIKDNSPYYQLSYSKKSVQIHSTTDSSGKPHNKASAGYSRHNQSKHHLKMHSKMSPEMKIARHSAETNLAMYYECGEGTTQTDHKDLVQCHNPKLYCNFSPSITKHCKSMSDKYDLAGTQMDHQLAQLCATSSGAAGKVNALNGALVGSFVPSLPPFPTTEELELCQGAHNNLVSTFLLMYRAHCQRILDAIVRANFDEVHTLVYHFWQQIPHHLTSVLASNLLVNLLAICDIRLYRTIVKLISVTLAQSLSEMTYNQLDDFVTNFDSVLSAALHKENIILQQTKVELSKHFAGVVKCLIRHSRVFHSIQDQGNSFSCPSAVKQMYIDWCRLDLHSLCSHLVDLYERTSKVSSCEPNWLKRIYQLLYKHCTEFKLFLASFTDYSQLFEWFENLWHVSLQWYRSSVSSKETHFDLEFAKHFVVVWTFARIRISQELIRAKAPSEDLFNTLAALFDDFCVYKVKDLYFDDCTTMLFGNATKNAKPTLPQYFDPLDVIKQTVSLLESWETVSTDNNEWYGGSQSRASNTAYHEMYGNLHSNAFWVNYGQQATSVNYYQESGQQYPNSGYADSSTTSEFGQEQTRPPRQDSLICFSMNFHANSIQVMTAPSSTSSNSKADSSVSEQQTVESVPPSHYMSPSVSQFNSPTSGSSTSSSSYRSIKCYLSSDTCPSSSATSSGVNNLYSL